MVHSHTVLLPPGALPSWRTMRGTGADRPVSLYRLLQHFAIDSTALAFLAQA